MNIPIDITGITIRTPRLLLRPWRETDLEDFFAYASVDGVGQMCGWNPHKNREETWEILQKFIAEKREFALEFGGKVIGALGLKHYQEAEHPELDRLKGCEIGYILSKPYWGQGLMPEAVQAMIRYFFEEKGWDFFTIGHFIWNTRSQRVIEKCGFTYTHDDTYDTRYNTTERTREYILYRKDWNWK